MVNEAGHFPEVCKKSMQAQAGDMAGTISEEKLRAMPLAFLERLDSARFEKLGRLAFPVIAEPGDSHFRRLGWDEALHLAGERLRQTPPDETFFYASGRSSNEAAFLFQLAARAYGTANIHNCSYYCHAASGVALSQVYGSGTASVVLEDLEKADLALVIGANPASNHPRLITQLVKLRRRGGRVLVINPLRELGLERFRIPSDLRSMLLGSTVSDLYLQPHVGADIPLLKALLKGVVERGGLDRSFVGSATAGWEEIEADLEASGWDELVAACGVPREEIDRAVGMLLEASSGVFLWAMGLTHHAHGVDNILALANLALARGWLGRPGTGLLPLRGHSNIQGVGSVGVTPGLKEAFARRMEEIYGLGAPDSAGQHTYASMVAADTGRIRAAVLLGGNLLASNPDSTWAAAALRKIPFSVSITTKLNEGHLLGRGRTSLILPVLARDEEPEPTTQESMFNFVRLSEGGSPAVEGEMRSEVEVIASLAERILPPGRFDWAALRSHAHLRREIARVVPGFEAMEAIDETRSEFQIAGRTFHEPRFATRDGKARFHVTPLPDFDLGPESFRLMTLRSEGQFNSVVYEQEDLYRGNTRRDVVMMAAEDAGLLGLEEGARAVVETEAGRLEVTVSVAPIRAGNLAMYYPEANVLVPRRLDARSRTPAFKSVIATVRPPGASATAPVGREAV
jgi:molybdopterin-dependent oxidoreductase alpha subunit